MATPKDWEGQDFGVRGDIVSIGGDIRTRLPGVNTGGGAVLARHVYAGGSAGGFHIIGTTALNDFSIMPDASPAANILFQSASDAVQWGSLEIATGILTLSSLVTAIDGGFTFGDGRANSGLVLPVNAEARSICNEDFTPLGWRLITDKSGTFRVQILRQSYSSYDNSTWVDVSGVSSGAGGMPATSFALKGTSSNLASWSSTADWTRGDAIRAIVSNNAAGAGWYALQVYGRRNVKKT